VAIPKLRTGSYFPEWLLERRTRAEQALTSVVATCYLLGLHAADEQAGPVPGCHRALEEPGLGDGPAMTGGLDVHVEEFRTRPLGSDNGGAGPFTFVAPTPWS